VVTGVVDPLAGDDEGVELDPLDDEGVELDPLDGDDEAAGVDCAGAEHVGTLSSTKGVFDNDPDVWPSL